MMMPLLIEATARTTVLALLATFALRLLRNVSPHQEKAVWTAVLLASLAMPWLMHEVAAPVIRAPAYLLTVSRGTTPTHSTSHWLGTICVTLYVLIAVAGLLRLAVSAHAAWRAHRNAKLIAAPWTLGMDVRISGQLRGPATFGGTVLLPECYPEWGPFKLDAVLAHEMSHRCGPKSQERRRLDGLVWRTMAATLESFSCDWAKEHPAYGQIQTCATSLPESNIGSRRKD
jgi:hypothetical protein